MAVTMSSAFGHLFRRFILGSSGFRLSPLSSASSHHSAMTAKVDYEEMRSLVEQKGGYILDVRNRDEVQTTGLIPGSVNVPLGELQQSLGMSDADFQHKYGAGKPASGQAVVCLCRSGKRSQSAVQVLCGNNFASVRSYDGSMNEWLEKGGPTEKA